MNLNYLEKTKAEIIKYLLEFFRIYFVTRVKSNTKIEIINPIDLNTKDKESNILLDADVMLGDYTSKTKMKHEMRLVRVKTIDRNNKEKIIDILNNRFDLEAHIIAKLYKKTLGNRVIL